MPLPPKPESLPTPSPDDATRSEALAALLRETMMASSGAIDFSRFMELALYAPGLGYYTSTARQFGERGDFITAPELSPIFGQCLARQCAEILVQLGGGSILEAGAGRGTLCVDILGELERSGQLPEQYFILELSAALKAEQQRQIEARLPHLANRVQWLAALPPAGFRGVVLANELLDAMPVELFQVTESGIRQLQVCCGNSGFAWTTREADAVIVNRIAPLGLPSDYVSEIGLVAEAWIRTLGTSLREGLLLLIDYGFPRHEFYHPQRTHGTLMCHYRHRAHADPLMLPGLQDITAHVDFTAIAEAGSETGLDCVGYTSQAAFLLATGIEQTVPGDGKAHRSWAEQVRKLTLPHEMGEFFKVMALGRGIASPLRGFALADRRGSL